jgi:hypothetical protein
MELEGRIAPGTSQNHDSTLVCGEAKLDPEAQGQSPGRVAGSRAAGQTHDPPPTPDGVKKP